MGLLVVWNIFTFPHPAVQVTIPYSTLIAQVHAGNVASVEAAADVTTDREYGKGSFLDIVSASKKVSFPILYPYGHVAFQAQRGDVHTVIVDGRVVKSEGRLTGVDLGAVRREVDTTVDYLRSVIGEEAWAQGMHPEIPETKVMDNPYTYTDYRSGSTHGH